MPLDYGLLGRPVNVMESLQALGQSQECAKQQQVQELKLKREELFQQQLGGAIDPMTGNVNASAARLAYMNAGNAEGALKFGRDQQTDFANRRKATAEPFAMAAWDVLQKPPEEQAMAWDAYVDQFAQQHGEAAMQFKGQFSPELAKAFLAETGHLDDFMKDQKPEFRNVAYGDTVVDMRGARDGGQPRVVIKPNNEGMAPQPPQSAADYLRSNPSFAGDYDAKYGKGSAAKVLGGQSGNPTGDFR